VTAVISTRTLSIALVLALTSLAAAGCGGGEVTDAEPVETNPATASGETTTDSGPAAPGGKAADPAERSAELCAQMRERIGSLPSPKGDGADAEFESELEAIQTEYLDGISELDVPEEDRDTLERFLIAERELFEAQAAARAEGADEGTEAGPAADATAEAEELASELGITGCAAV
jgi:hypothetical protein